MFNWNYSIHPAGDSACRLVFGERIDKQINEIVLTVFRHLQSIPRGFITDLVPSYAALTVFYDPVAVLQQSAANLTSYEHVCNYLVEHLNAIRPAKNQQRSRELRIPVCYSGEFAPDLTQMASTLQLTTDEIIRLHVETSYRVYMIGFQPGFAYMGEVDERISFPRKEKPARKVAAGSVGIAGRQTGIYPFDSPGGWMIIGRTPINIFNKAAANPIYFQPGDQVTFYSINKHEFENYKVRNT